MEVKVIRSIKTQFFPVSNCVSSTMWMYHTRRWLSVLRKKLDWNCTRILRVILNKSWKQYPTKQQLYGHLPPISKTIQIRRAKHARHWRNKDELISGVLLSTLSHGRAKEFNGRPTGTYLRQLNMDTGCSLEDMPKVIDDKDEWQESQGNPC